MSEEIKSRRVTSSRGELPDLHAGVYRHHKGHLYLVLGYAQDSTNDAEDVGMPFVVYVGLQMDGQPSPVRMRCRRAVEFFSVVQRSDGEWVDRFTYVGPQAW